MIDYRKLLKTSFLVTMHVNSRVPDKYIYHLDLDELRELDKIIDEILTEDPHIIRPASHPYVGSAKWAEDLEQLRRFNGLLK